jgi:hypothetical protein
MNSANKKPPRKASNNGWLFGVYYYLTSMTILTVLTILYYIRNVVIIVHVVNGLQMYLPAAGASAPGESHAILFFQFLRLGIQSPG